MVRNFVTTSLVTFTQLPFRPRNYSRVTTLLEILNGTRLIRRFYLNSPAIDSIAVFDWSLFDPPVENRNQRPVSNINPMKRLATRFTVYHFPRHFITCVDPIASIVRPVMTRDSHRYLFPVAWPPIGGSISRFSLLRCDSRQKFPSFDRNGGVCSIVNVLRRAFLLRFQRAPQRMTFYSLRSLFFLPLVRLRRLGRVRLRLHVCVRSGWHEGKGYRSRSFKIPLHPSWYRNSDDISSLAVSRQPLQA